MSFSTIQNDYSLGRVNKTNNKLVFFWNEPINDYDISFTFKNSIENFHCKSPQQLIDASLTNANSEAAVQGRLYDALVFSKSDRDMAIIWKDKAKDNAIARVKKTDGKLVFIECEPINDYEIVGKYDVSGVGQQLLIGTCPTHNQKIDKLIKKSEKDKLDYDAIMYGSSKHDLAVKFK
jgi:hypothetical protein